MTDAATAAIAPPAVVAAGSPLIVARGIVKVCSTTSGESIVAI